MRKETLSTLFLLILVAGCERVPVLEARVQGEGLAPILAYQVPGKSPQYWTIEDDWHRLFMRPVRGRKDYFFSSGRMTTRHHRHLAHGGWKVLA